MSSSTATESGAGFGSSPNAYINSFTSISCFKERMYSPFGRGSVYVRYGDGEHGPPCLWSTDLGRRIVRQPICVRAVMIEMQISTPNGARRGWEDAQ